MTGAEASRAFLSRLVGAATGKPVLVLILTALLTALSCWYAATHLKIETDNTDLLSAELPFRQDAIRLKEAFPQYANNIVIVIDAPTPDQADDAAMRLGQELRKQTGLFPWVFDPAADPWLRKQGLLFLNTEELADLVDRLAASQAFLGRLWHDPSLRGLFDLLRQAISANSTELPAEDLARVISALAQVAPPDAARPVSWRSLIGGEAGNVKPGRRTILVQPSVDFDSLSPGADAMTAIRETARAQGLTPDRGFRVRLTGSVPLEREELASVAEGMGWAGLISLILVLSLLWAAFRSPMMVFATLLTLIVGLIWTAGLATLIVGRLNLISVAFAVLFIGLSVDFGIHFALKLREAVLNGAPYRPAAGEAAGQVGGALTLCAVAAAIAFFSFMPTRYVGLAELGVIAGTGMVVALIANLTVLPALLFVLPVRFRQTHMAQTGARFLTSGWQVRHARLVLLVAAFVAMASAILVPKARFDFDPMNLRDSGTESVSTVFDLIEGSDRAPYSIEVLAKNRVEARLISKQLEKLASVDRVVSIDKFVASDQQEKLALIEEAAFLLEPAFSAKRLERPDTEAIRASIDRFREAAEKNRREALRDPLAALLTGLAQVPDTSAGYEELRYRLLSTLTGRLTALQTALKAEPAIIADIPQSVRDGFVDKDGRWRLIVFPKGDLRDTDALKAFVAEVTSVTPRASGGPVIIVAAGDAVLEAFVTAGLISVIAIGVLVAVLLRRLRDVLLIFAPLVLAAVITIAVTVVIGIRFNFANIIVLPLLFGLGVASAIHLVLRSRTEPDLNKLMATSTPRAVLYSALTTIGSFASIAISSHPGTASMGVLLAISISLTLICTIAVLPALLHLTRRHWDASDDGVA